ncbi:MAG: hypothetical protein WDN00_19240 [Limisphaerales bacterium]
MPKSSGLITQLQSWWSKVSSFDRRWTYICAAIFGASLIGCFVYASEKPALVRYLQVRGYPDQEFANSLSRSASARRSGGWGFLRWRWCY